MNVSDLTIFVPILCTVNPGDGLAGLVFGLISLLYSNCILCSYLTVRKLSFNGFLTVATGFTILLFWLFANFRQNPVDIVFFVGVSFFVFANILEGCTPPVTSSITVMLICVIPMIRLVYCLLKQREGNAKWMEIILLLPVTVLAYFELYYWVAYKLLGQIPPS